MFNPIKRFFICISADINFKSAWKRAEHIENGHPFNESVLIEKLRSENHPHTSKDYVYTVNIRTCEDCGLTFTDNGIERR